jgi:hypothetical protein
MTSVDGGFVDRAAGDRGYGVSLRDLALCVASIFPVEQEISCSS